MRGNVVLTFSLGEKGLEMTLIFRRNPISPSHMSSPLCRCCHDASFTVVIFLFSSPFSSNPLADVRWAILELYVVRFAALKKTDNVLIHEP